MSDEGFWGSIGGWLERFWGRWRRYGAAEGQGGVEPEKDKYKDKDKDGGMGQPRVKTQGGVEPASTRAVCQTREKFSVAGRSAYNEVAGGLTMVYMDDLKIYRISLQPAQA